MADTEFETVSQRIRALFESLTRAERQLANRMLENYPVSSMGSITTVAEEAGVSAPTVARMARKLGFSGFPDLQAALRRELEAAISDPITKHDHWASDADTAHILYRFTESVLDNLRNSLKQIDIEAFDRTVSLLSDRRHALHIVGGRITRSLADYFFTHMQVIRPDVTLVASNSNSWPHYLLNMQEGDVLVVFDIRRYEHNIVRLAEVAQSRGVSVVLITDQWGSPASKHSTVTFNLRIEVPSAWDSSVVPMTLVESLIAAVQADCWEETKARMKTLEDLFDHTKLFRKFL